MQKLLASKAVEDDAPQIVELKALKAQCQELINSAPEAVNKWYTFTLEDLMEEMDEVIAEPSAAGEDRLKYFKAQMIAIDEDFLSPDALAATAMLEVKHQSLINSQDFDWDMLNVSASYRLSAHTAPALE